MGAWVLMEGLIRTLKLVVEIDPTLERAVGDRVETLRAMQESVLSQRPDGQTVAASTEWVADFVWLLDNKPLLDTYTARFKR